MTIIQLEYLLAVANHGSFSQAAEKCFVTQPSLSMQVKNLEEELGVILLDRSKKPVIPTEAGTLVLNQAREAVMAFRRVTEAVNDLKGEVSGLLRLGVIPTIAPYLLHRFVPEFTRKYPKVELQIKEMVTADIVAALNRDMLDAAILAPPPAKLSRRSCSTTGFTPMSRRCIRCTSAVTFASRTSM